MTLPVRPGITIVPRNTIGPALPKNVRAALKRAQKQYALRTALRQFERTLDAVTLGATGAGKSAARAVVKGVRGESVSGSEAGTAALLAAALAFPAARGLARGLRREIGGGIRTLRGDPEALRGPLDVFESGFRSPRRAQQFLRENPDVRSRLLDPTMFRKFHP